MKIDLYFESSFYSSISFIDQTTDSIVPINLLQKLKFRIMI